MALPYTLRPGVLPASWRNGSGTRLLELGQTLSSSELRTTEFAPAVEAELPSKVESARSDKQTPSVTYGPAQWARPAFTGGFPGSAFTPQPDGTLRCPADRPLSAQERRPERDGSLRILYAARLGHCRDWTAAEHSVKKAPQAEAS